MKSIDRRGFLTTAGSAAVAGFTLMPSANGQEKPEFPANTPEGEIEGTISKWSADTKKSYDELVTKVTEILSDPKERAEIFDTIAGKLVTLGANTPHTYPFLNILYKATRAHLNDSPIRPSDEDRKKVVEGLRPLRTTDVIHPAVERRGGRPAVASYRNLGVIHAGGMYWERQKEKIYKAIDEADIVHLEKGESAWLGWFDEIEDYIRDEGKQVRYFEGNGGSKVAAVANTLALLCIYDMLQLNPLKQADRGTWTREYVKAWIYQQLGHWPLSSSISDRLAKYAPHGTYSGRWAFDHTKDARTIWMWLDLQKERRKDPDKRHLSLAGDGHAEGFEFYDKHPAEMQIKRALYNVVLCLHRAADLATKK